MSESSQSHNVTYIVRLHLHEAFKEMKRVAGRRSLVAGGHGWGEGGHGTSGVTEVLISACWLEEHRY